MAKTFNQFTKKIDELYWPKGGDEAKFMAMHGPYSAADVGGKETHDDAVFKGTIVGKDESHAHTDAEFRPDAQSELNDLIKNIHSKDTDELLKTVSHLNLSTDPKHREARDVINKELMYRYKNHAVNEELVGGQKKLDADGDKHLTAKDFAILRARKNKKMNEGMAGPHGYVPKADAEKFGTHMASAGFKKNIHSGGPEGDYSHSSNPAHGADVGYQKGRAAVRLNTPEAKAHAKKFPSFTSATNEETELDEGWVSVNGQRVGPRRQPMSFAQRVAAKGGERTPEQKAKTEKALKDIEDKISAKFTPDYMKKVSDNAAAERKRQVDAEKKRRGIGESAVKNPYAVGTAAAEKSTGDTPPLAKSTINKSHKIAKAIMRKESVNFNTEEIELEDGNVIEIDIELAEAIADLFDSLDEDDQDALAEMLHSDIESFMEVVDLLENDGE